MMPVVELIRLEEDVFSGTFGVLKVNKQVFCVTLEPPDLENRRNLSSIPAQQYLCRRCQSPAFGETFAVKQVPGRDGVLFHPGNLKKHSKGCILLGGRFGNLRHNRAILNSGATFKAFMDRMHGVGVFHLTVMEQY